MSILTEKEIEDIEEANMIEGEYKWQYSYAPIANARERAVIAKLTAGVEMPEPHYFNHLEADGAIVYTPWHTPKQLQTAIAAVRVKALEDAVNVVLNFQAGWVPDGFTECADAIRALKGGV